MSKPIEFVCSLKFTVGGLGAAAASVRKATGQALATEGS